MRCLIGALNYNGAVFLHGSGMCACGTAGRNHLVRHLQSVGYSPIQQERAMKKTAQTLRIALVATALAAAGGAHALEMGAHAGGGFMKVAATSDNSNLPPANSAPGMPGHTEGDKEKRPAATNDLNADHAKQAVTDSALTTKVKAKLLTTKDLKATGIHVKTKDRVVNLTGTVPTKSQHEMALSTVRSVDGVASVNDELKVSSH